MNQPGRPLWGARERTFGWYRVYKGFVGHRKWRAIARATGIEVCRVQAVATALLEEANESRPRGSLVDFDVYDCAATLEIEAEEVARVYAELEFRQWIVHDQIATWDKRQPDREDPDAAARKDRSRTNLKATRRMLASPPAAIELPPEDDRSDDAQVARMYWLNTFGNKLICERLRVKDKVAAVLIQGWLRDARKDYTAVASIITAAIDLGLEGELFRNQVKQRIVDLRNEVPGQRPLPLGLRLANGGAA
jgi:tRNA threonylcarbamoyladenosine modification (KEOPS) complex  Pcc1 subunit